MRIYLQNALNIAVSDNELEIISKVISGGHKFEGDELLQLLTTCCDYNTIEIAKILIPLTANKHLVDIMVYASRTGKTEIIRLILLEEKKRNQDILFSKQRDSKALRYASKHGNLEAVNLLIENKADVNAVLGESLRHACWKGHFNIVKILIENKADINVNKGEPLKKAKKGGFQDIISLINETNKPTTLGESKERSEEKV